MLEFINSYDWQTIPGIILMLLALLLFLAWVLLPVAVWGSYFMSDRITRELRRSRTVQKSLADTVQDIKVRLQKHEQANP